jgi:superfamily II DNA or RNA helicase
MQLRDYQQQAIVDTRAAFFAGHRRVLLVAPTGAGKTVMFSYLAGSISANRQRVVLLAHRDELLDQISRTLNEFQVQHGFIAARRTLNLEVPVQVAGVHTLKSRASRLAWRPDWIICDEAHHATAGSWRQIVEAYPDARVFGVTATPARLDGRGLGDVFDAMVRGPEVADLMERGFLSRAKYYCPKTVDTDGMRSRMGEYAAGDIDQRVNNSRVTGEAVDWYRRLCAGQPAVAFCASIRHSEHVAETFRAAGFRWSSLDSRMTPEARRAAVQGLASGALHGVSSCDIISEGFDLPKCTAAILLRPTQSLGLYLQQVGRVLRVAPGKPHAIIIDHVGNCGSTRDGQWIEKHGFAEDIREWSLDGKVKRKGAAPVRLCPACYAAIPAGCRACPECGFTPPVQERELPQQDADGELEEVVKPARVNTAELERRAVTLEDWQRIAALRGYKRGWAWHRHQQRLRVRYKLVHL